MTVRNDPQRPAMDYLSRDYAGLRQLLLNHFAVRLPDWTERHAADLGVTLVELLAWAGDYLSYYQDAVAAEAYFSTARQRISLRRHTRLVDYALNEGVNARTFVHLGTAEDHLVIPAGTTLLTDIISSEPVVSPDVLQSSGGVIFETMHDIELFRAHNQMHFDSSGGAVLAAGATAATLRGHLPYLRRGDLLLLQPLPVAGEPLPDSGHVVRLAAEPEPGAAPGGGPVTTVRWFDEDALSAAMPVAPRVAEGGTAGPLCAVLGNLVLADHGHTVTEVLSPVPDSGSYNPRLRSAGVTHAAPYSHREAIEASAAAALLQSVELTNAAISLVEAHPAQNTDDFKTEWLRGERWYARRDLLASSRFARDFVAEVGNSGICSLRFGDGEYGRRPVPGSAFRAGYRIGQGVAGNVGAQAIRHIVWGDRRIVAVTNPLAATGGTDPETAVQVRINAPQAFRVQRRCVTESDYEEMTRRFPGIANASAQRIPLPQPRTVDRTHAAATDVVTIHIERAGHAMPSPGFLARVRNYLLPFALIGDELEILAAIPQPVEIQLSVSVLSGFATAEVLKNVTDRVRSAIAATPFRLGEPVYASRWVAVATSVPGVASVSASLLSAIPPGDGPAVSSVLRTSFSVTVPQNAIASLTPAVIPVTEGA